MVRKITYITGIILIWCFRLSAQQVTARASLDTVNMLIGQQVDLKLKVEMPSGKTIGWPVFGDSLCPGVQVVHISRIDTLVSQDKKMLTLSQRIKITSFDTGTHVIPSIPFYAGKPGSVDSGGPLAATEQLLLQITTVAVDTTKAIKDVKGPMALPLTFREMLPWIIGGILFLLLVYFIYYYIRRRNMAKPLFGLLAKPELPPHIAALEALEKLRTRKLWQAGKIKEYHTEVTEILRIYIEKRFGIMALEMVSDEILDAFAAGSINTDAYGKLREVLITADLVKFAKLAPLPDQHDQSLKFAIDFINETILKPSPESTENNGVGQEPDKITENKSLNP